jgi:transcription-repair coupling factor (superfamily II helicase)
MRIAEWAVAYASDAFARPFPSDPARIGWRSIAPNARPFLIATELGSRPGKTLVVVANYDRALQWQARLTLCGVPEALVRRLPSGGSALYEDSAPETVALSDRIGALRFLAEPGPGIVLATAQAALERTLPRAELDESFIDLAVGDEIPIDRLVRRLARLGYESAEPVRMPGQYSRRGGIVDVFAMGSERPARLEFFGDEIETLRSFDANSQRSTGPLDRLALGPSRETLFHAEGGEALRELIASAMEREADALPPVAAERLRETVGADLRALEARVFFDRLDLYRPWLHPDSGCAVDLLGEDGLLVLDEPLELEAVANRAASELAEALAARAARGEILHATAGDFVLGPEHLAVPARQLALSAMNAFPDWLELGEIWEADAASLESYHGRGDALALALRNWLNAGLTVVVSTDQPNRATAVLEKVELAPAAAGVPGEPGMSLAHGNLAGGFVSPALRLAVVTDQELFGVSRLRLPQRRFNEGVPIATVLDLKPGDYVVHINYGIGIFRGLTKRTVDGLEKEYLFVEYAAPDKLYVPADQLDRIQKYLNPTDVEPKLNRLTGGDWQRTVGKAREEAREFARGLIKLYAARKKVSRPAYGPDTPWQAEMESTFPWVETASQMQAIRETKADLNQPFPMDRLVCGDVGFGKTEVAIRAAFKVATSGRQVVVLCPTTILSEQHYRSFTERLAPWPVRVELLNRFRTAAERARVLKGLKDGEVDIVIGTHALLGKAIDFKDVGLVIIDEEQKFGVKQKEALKELRVSVDVLTLSATPIPRTLSMALMDIRQMSLINDPPPGRLPIRTFVRPYAGEVVREAILRELARGGQVYYVYNRVQGIFHVAEKLRKLVPNARIGIGHGQMTEQELEPIMIGFINGEIDVLLSTTIVESGLDIPNANTLVVENADRLGLAQLYQLRGRVGRSDRQAYAYLLYNVQELNEEAGHRLQALQEFSSLGSGYSLAFRDLQIRGAGDLLGAKQSGTMATVGYELFTQLVNEEVSFLKAHVDGARADYNDPLEGLAPLPTVDLPIAALIPESYIPDQAQRLYFYKEMMSARDPGRLAQMREEMVDRYGREPEEVDRAVRVMRLRMAARDLGVEKADGNGGRIAVTLTDSGRYSPRVWSLLAARHGDAYFTRGQLIWPYTGDPLIAAETCLAAFAEVAAEVDRQRAAVMG